MSTMETDEDISLYRKVSATEYYYGYSSNGKKDALLIVYEPDDKTMAREYYKEEEVWTCLGCHNLGEEVCITKIMDKEILTPLKHFCESRTVEEIVKEQKDYKNLLLSGFLEREADFYSSSTEFDKFDPSEYKFGVDSLERQNSRLIVQQKDNPENVYHYHKHGKRWICHGCISITHNIDTFGELIKKDLYLPKQHVCEPIKAEQSEQEQQYLLFNTANLFVDNLFNEQKDALRMLNHYEFKFCTSGLDGFKKKIIVSHPSNRSLIYNFYYKSQSIWHCTKCVQEKKLDTYVIQKDGNMYVSMKHACQPINYFDAGGIQLSVGNSQGRKDKNESMEVQEEAAEILLSDDPSLPSSSDKHSESTKVKKSKKRKASDSDITSIPPPPSQPGTSDGSNNSEILAKIPRMFKQIGGGAKNNVIRVFTPKRSSFPVRIPPSYIHARNKSGKPVTPSVINYRPPPIVSLSPIYLDDGSESRKNPKSSNINSSPDNNASTKRNNDKFVLKNISSKDSSGNTSNANNNSFDGTTESRNKKNRVEADDDEIQIIEPHIPLIPNLQNQSVSSALLKFIDSKIEDNRNEISLNITASPASSPILPFENDKVADTEENSEYEENNITEMDEINELARLISPSEPSTSTDEINYNPSYRFEAPTDAFIRSTLEKLKIPFIRKALHFWAEVLYSEIPATCSPESTFAITSSVDSFFKCLSCFFTGKENYYFFIKAQIQSYLCNNYKNFESDDEIDFSKLDVTSRKFQQFYQCSKLTNAHFNFICQWLQCRIGIFTNNEIFEKYGNWNDTDEENIPILLIQNKRNFYKPVLTLI